MTAFVQGFLRAFNQGDQHRLLLSFPARGAHLFRYGAFSTDINLLQIYSVRGRGARPFATDSQQVLLAYFASRHRHHETLRLLSLRTTGVGAYSGTKGVGISFRLTRQADDLGRRAVFGKGEINCERGLIAVWIMADDPHARSATTSLAGPVQA